MKAILLVDRRVVVREDKYVVSIKVYEVEKSKKFPEGIKAKFVLRDIERGSSRLLVDNHEPFGFHMHTRLPQEKDHRVKLDVKEHNEALTLFFEEVERIVRNEE